MTGWAGIPISPGHAGPMGPLSTGVQQFKGFFQFFVHHVGVNLGGGEVAVAQRFFDQEQAPLATVEIRGKGVPQGMGGFP